MLAEICGWFTEGFDTADLKDAKALLEELAHSPTSLYFWEPDPLAATIHGRLFCPPVNAI
jgi:hypothetical protein